MRKILTMLVVGLLSLPLFSVSALSPRAGVSILGDSYSTFEGHVSPDTNAVWYFKAPRPDLTDVSDVSQLWWNRLIREKGLRLVVNNSFSGATISHRGYRGEDYSDRSFLTRAKELGSPDVILVFGATNDSWAGVDAGEYPREDGKAADGSEPDFYTFRPALDRMLETLVDYYPGTDIYFIVNTELRPEITESVVTLCKRHGVEAIRLEDIDKKAGHPTVKGMEQIAAQVGARLK
ncbi:MAG: SGNH/GDSL hydrolase family protein [Staphylococcus sp.]|nr:SGNH/GDSL hydrolase family protein [Staphylococcus sp.]